MIVLSYWHTTKCSAWKLSSRLLNTNNSSTVLTCRVRLAITQDIPFINQCNRKTLPENYTGFFFEDQLARWPSLSIVAETVDTGDLMGYALGRLKESFDTDSFEALNKIEIGHCGSIAVYEQHRGKGIAKYLMDHLHYNLAERYRMDKISLLCRPSNTAALHLYSKVLQYQTIKEMKNYYPDGENAFYMERTGLVDWHKTIVNPHIMERGKHIDLKL